jgi:hypothetical protein
MQHNEERLYASLFENRPELESESLTTVETALKEEISKQHFDLMNVARIVERIDWGLYNQLPGCKSVEQYFCQMPSRLGIPKQTVSHWRKVARAYNRHRLDFDTYGVIPTKVVSKLAHLERALKNHPKEKSEVFSHLANDRVREFVKYSKGTPEAAAVQTSSTGEGARPPARRVDASELESDHRRIAKILSRRNEPLVLSAMTQDHAVDLNLWLRGYQAERLHKLLQDAGTVLPDHDQLDFPETANLFDLEVALKGYYERDQISKAKVAVRVYRIATDGKLKAQWQELGFNSSSAYCEDRLGIGTEYSWLLRIGAAIVKYKDELSAWGFAVTDQLYKLAYLEKALERAATDEERERVFKRLTRDSFRSFKRLAGGKEPITETPTWLTTSVVQRAAKVLNKVRSIEERGEFPVILEITTEAEKAGVLHYDALNRPQSAEPNSESSAA